jgi:hypothetical protein
VSRLILAVLLVIKSLLGSSGSLQELIEALSLRHYLLHGEMISYDQVQQFLTSGEGEKVRLLIRRANSIDFALSI